MKWSDLEFTVKNHVDHVAVQAKQPAVIKSLMIGPIGGNQVDLHLVKGSLADSFFKERFGAVRSKVVDMRSELIELLDTIDELLAAELAPPSDAEVDAMPVSIG